MAGSDGAARDSPCMSEEFRDTRLGSPCICESKTPFICDLKSSGICLCIVSTGTRLCSRSAVTPFDDGKSFPDDFKCVLRSIVNECAVGGGTALVFAP